MLVHRDGVTWTSSLNRSGWWTALIAASNFIFSIPVLAQENGNQPPLPAEDPLPPPNTNNAAPPPPTPPAPTPPPTGSTPPPKPAGEAPAPRRNTPPADGNRGAARIPAGQELVNMDFPEPTEIKDIIKAVALWTGKNVILDRSVQGKIQIISPKRVTKEEAYQAFLSALNVLGLTTVETGKVIKILQVRTAIKGNLKTFLGSNWTPLTDEIITQIVPLKYIDARAIQSTLSRIVSSNSMIAYEPTNTLIISDSGYKVRRVLDILELLDVQGQQAQVAIVPIKYAEAKAISDRVQEILKGTAAQRPGGGGGSFRNHKIMHDDRMNSVIIFGPPRTISDVKALVRKFDVPVDDPSRQSTIHVRPLDYADAKKLASTLSALATAGKGNNIRRPPVPVRLPGQPNLPGVPGSLPGAAPADQGPAVAELDDNVKITADESSNSLLITGSRSAYQALNSIIRKLDIRRSQVYVEADILDLDMTSGFDFKTSVFGGRGGPGGSSIATTWQGGAMAPLVAAQAGTASTSQAQVEKVAGVFAEDLSVGILSGKEIEIAGLGKFRPGALVRLIKTDANTRILSSPNIMTLNNEEATIQIGDRIFYQSSEFNAQTGVAVPKVEKEDVSLTLGVKPNISHSNYITMQVNIESDGSQGKDAATNLPIVKKRKSKQLVTVKNGQTVVISGLVQTRENEVFKKIPLLGDIPILGWLFRNSSTSSQQSNLMIFLTPHIVHGADDLAAIYKAKIEDRDQFLENIYGSSFKDDFYARLPSMEDGAYRPDEVDKAEKQRREEMLDDMYRSSGFSLAPKTEGNGNGHGGVKADEAPVYVPVGDGEAGPASGMDALPPMPPPPPLPPPDGMDGGQPEPIYDTEPPPPIEPPPSGDVN